MANTAISTPATLVTNGGTGSVSTGLTLLALQTKLRMETTLGDIFEELGADVVNDGNKMSVPNAIFMTLDAVPQGARQVTIPMIKPLSAAPTIGPGTPAGGEEGRSLNYATFFYDEYSHAVSIEHWGINYNEMEMYGVFQRAQPDLSKYMREFRGQRIREALLLTYDSVLTASTSTVQKVPHFNKNWYVPSTAPANQPAWDATATTRIDGTGVLTVSDGVGVAVDATPGTYTVTGTASASGTGVTLEVVMSAVAATAVAVVKPGAGYVVGETISVAKAGLGGGTGAATIVFTVATVSVADTTLSADHFSAASAGIGENFVNEIAQTILTAAGNTAGATASALLQADLNYFLTLENYASNDRRIDPIVVDGQDTYVVLVPSPNGVTLRKNSSGSLGEVWIDTNRTSDKDVMNYSGKLGRVGKLLLIEDQRYPTIQLTGIIDGVDGDATSMVIETQFVKPGNGGNVTGTDNRHKTPYSGVDASGAAAVVTAADNCNLNIGFLLGKGALCEWEVKKLHFEKEVQDYGKYEGVGVFGESGIQLVQYDDDAGFAGTNDTRENFGSIVLPFANPSLVS